MTYNTGESLARASAEKNDVNLSGTFGGKKVEKKQDDGYGGYTEQEGGNGKGKGSSGKPLESHE